jgi:hypothetical protein
VCPSIFVASHCSLGPLGFECQLPLVSNKAGAEQDPGRLLDLQSLFKCLLEPYGCIYLVKRLSLPLKKPIDLSPIPPAADLEDIR